MEYGLSIMPLKRGYMKNVESSQYESLCRMLSVGRKSSYKTLQLLTNLPSMAIRVGVLKSKFVARFKSCKEDPELLTPKIERWSEKYGIVTVMNQVMVDSPLALDDHSKKEDILKFQKLHFEELLKSIPMFYQTPLGAIDIRKLQNVIKGKVGNNKDINTVCMFLLSKYPGKPEICNVCNEKLSKDHIVKCNLLIWIKQIELWVKNPMIKKIICSHKQFFTNRCEWPYYLVTMIAEGPTRPVKEILLKGLADSLRSSFITCLKKSNK